MIWKETQTNQASTNKQMKNTEKYFRFCCCSMLPNEADEKIQSCRSNITFLCCCNTIFHLPCIMIMTKFFVTRVATKAFQPQLQMNLEFPFRFILIKVTNWILCDILFHVAFYFCHLSYIDREHVLFPSASKELIS